MKYKDIINLYIIDMKNQGMYSQSAAPIYYRFLWLIGFKIKPPVFQNTLTLFISHTIIFYLLFLIYLIIMIIPTKIRIYSYFQNPIPLINIILDITPDLFDPLGFALIMGMAISFYYTELARILKLPKWEIYIQKTEDSKDL